MSTPENNQEPVPDGPLADPAPAAEPAPPADAPSAGAGAAPGGDAASGEPGVPAADAAQAEAEVRADVDADAEESVPPTPAEEPAPEPEPDFQDLYLRTAAEMDNLRKRARRDVGAAEGRGVAKLAKELLPALDNLDRAIAAAEAAEGDEEHTLTRGIRLVQSELTAALTRVGITVEIPLGAPFDPHRHEALTQVPKENTPPGLVVDVYQPGYVYGEAVLRAAKVVVSA